MSGDALLPQDKSKLKPRPFLVILAQRVLGLLVYGLWESKHLNRAV